MKSRLDANWSIFTLRILAKALGLNEIIKEGRVGKGRSVIPEPGGQSDHFQLRKSLLSSPSPSLFLSPVSSASFPILKPPVL